MGMAHIETAETQLNDIRLVLGNTDLQVRIEFGLAWGSYGTLQTAQVYARPRISEGNAKGWKKVGPFLTTPLNTRAALLATLADLTKED